MSQIPTYVTGVPNGTEKVRFFPPLSRSRFTHQGAWLIL